MYINMDVEILITQWSGFSKGKKKSYLQSFTFPGGPIKYDPPQLSQVVTSGEFLLVGGTTLVTHRPLAVSGYSVKASRVGAKSFLSAEESVFMYSF